MRVTQAPRAAGSNRDELCRRLGVSMASADRPLLHALLEDRQHVAHPANTQAAAVAAGQSSAAPFVSPVLRPAAAVQDPQLTEALTAAAVQPTVILAAPSEGAASLRSQNLCCAVMMCSLKCVGIYS